MKAYSIFDDFTDEAGRILHSSGIDLVVHPLGVPRPDPAQMKGILEEFDCVIIGTTQKISEDMFDNIFEPRIIATASVGLDHIRIPEEKKRLITILNTPKANAQSVAEYTMGCALSCCKRLKEGEDLYKAGRDNKALYRKPEDLSGKTIGVIGAGNISARIMDYSRIFGMDILCWTKHPEDHRDLEELGTVFTGLEKLAECADIISVNLPNNAGTKGLISRDLISKMKDTSIIISVSRLETIDVDALFEKAVACPGFYVCLDLDVNRTVIEKTPNCPNVMVTPHIAGGTVETRKRMFKELAEKIAEKNNEISALIDQQVGWKS